jgi:hypothetical protein
MQLHQAQGFDVRYQRVFNTSVGTNRGKRCLHERKRAEPSRSRNPAESDDKNTHTNHKATGVLNGVSAKSAPKVTHEAELNHFDNFSIDFDAGPTQNEYFA